MRIWVKHNLRGWIAYVTLPIAAIVVIPFGLIGMLLLLDRHVRGVFFLLVAVCPIIVDLMTIRAQSTIPVVDPNRKEMLEKVCVRLMYIFSFLGGLACILLRA